MRNNQIWILTMSSAAPIKSKFLPHMQLPPESSSAIHRAVAAAEQAFRDQAELHVFIDPGHN